MLAAWLWAIAASAQGRVRRWDWRKKDSVWVDITRFDINERLYFGDMVASGTWGEPVRIYNEAGYIDIAGDDSVSYHFYERDRKISTQTPDYLLIFHLIFIILTNMIKLGGGIAT